MNVILGVGDTVNNSINKKTKDCQRIILGDPNNHKYAEIITFCNCSSSGNYALAIGLNPALMNPQRFDPTNRKIANYLKDCQKNYDGYVLLNLYATITNSSYTLCKHIKQNPMDLSNNMQDQVLNAMKIFSGDIYLFWGPNALKKRLLTNAEILFYIQQTLTTKNYYYSTDLNQKFVHPGDPNFTGFDKLNSIQSIL